MNLNIYGQGSNTIQDLEANLKSQYEKLNQLKMMSNNLQAQNPVQSQLMPNQQANMVQPQRYYLDCGIKEDWDEFLRLNYGITEKAIFDDYKLFLQAKQEIQDEQGRNKLESMKSRIKNNGVYPTAPLKEVKPNVQPQLQPTKPTIKPTTQPIINTIQSTTGLVNDSSNTINGGIIQPINPVLPESAKTTTTKGRSKKQ